MHVKLWTLRYSPDLGAIDDGPLVAFLKGVEVLSFREHFFTAGGLAHLACIVEWREEAAAAADGRAAPPVRKRDERPAAARGRAVPELSGPDLERFERLRAWRAGRARELGVPPFRVFSNRELAQIVRSRPSSVEALAELKGIGAGRVRDYGEGVLAALGSGQ